MKLPITALAVAVAFACSLSATAHAQSADQAAGGLVLHKSGVAVFPAANSVPETTVLLHRSGVAVPVSSTVQYRQPLPAPDRVLRFDVSAVASDGGLSTVIIVLICAGGVVALVGAWSLGARFERRRRFSPARLV